VLRRQRQREAAAPPPRVLEEAGLAELVRDLDQVVLGDTVRPRNLGDGDPTLGMHGQIDQHTQAVVGIAGQAHVQIRSVGGLQDAGGGPRFTDARTAQQLQRVHREQDATRREHDVARHAQPHQRLHDP